MAAKHKLAQPRRGEIYLVSFDPTIGSEVRKTRPALILQNDTANEFSPITIVAAITSQFGNKLYPTEILIQPPEGGLTVKSVVLLNQVRSIDKQRLIKYVGKLTDVTISQVNEAIQISLGLIEI
jgi:mRNA interferase MazF